jgi:Flp pilus assembly protein TadG
MPVPRNIIQNEDGAVAVEAALVSSFILVPMLLGLWDVAQIGFGQSQAQEALQAAVTYVAAGNAGNSSGITAAAQNAYGTSINVSTSSACYCVPTTSSTPTSPSSIGCTSSCASGNDFEQFMNITISKTVPIPFPVPYLGSSVIVTSTGRVRTG